MGAGAYLNIVNNRSEPVTSLVGDMNCMFDGGDEGSNLQAFANATIAAGEAFPGGPGQYIEAKGSGGCALESSNFYIGFAEGGGFGCTEEERSWSAGDSSPGVDLEVNPGGDQATILVTLS